jgi:hypothetical protein
MPEIPGSILPLQDTCALNSGNIPGIAAVIPFPLDTLRLI